MGRDSLRFSRFRSVIIVAYPWLVQRHSILENRGREHGTDVKRWLSNRLATPDNLLVFENLQRFHVRCVCQLTINRFDNTIHSHAL